jgi:hypothetical protein
MSSRLNLEPTYLDKFLVKIRERTPFKDLHANPFFYLVKPSDENLLKYKYRKPENKYHFILDLLMYIPTICFEISKSVAHSILLMTETKEWKFESIDSCKYIFISHFTYAQDPKKEDIFFGKNLNHKSSFTLYLNHTRQSSKIIQSNFRSVNKRNIAVNSKSLMPLQLMQLQFNQMKTSSWILTEALTCKGLTINMRRLLIRAAIFQHSRPTIANLVLRKRLTELLSALKPEYIVFTIEGHSHERMVMKLREEFFQNTKLIGYQHAPIVPTQYNFLRIAKLFCSQDYILTSGDLTRKVIESQSRRCRTGILGSPKSRDYTYSIKDSLKLKVLLAPEGTRESLTRFVVIVNELTKLVPQVLFILRPHPALGSKTYKIVSSMLINRSNVIVSESSLTDDLGSAHLVLFQSSAIAIEGLAFGTYPIHIDFQGTGSLNPLACTSINSISLKSIDEIVSYLKTFDLKNSTLEVYQRGCFSQFLNYFAKLQLIDSIVY